MKRVLLFLLVFLMAVGFAFSADLMDYPPPLNGGNILVDIGVGYTFPDAASAIIKIPPIIASAEYCLPSVPISVGALIGFYQYEWDSVSYGWGVETWTYATFDARANWHWNIDASWLDLYTGALLGYTYFNSSYSRPYLYAELKYGGLEFGAQAGAHFYFSEHFGVVAELGYPFIAKVGLTLKF